MIYLRSGVKVISILVRNNEGDIEVMTESQKTYDRHISDLIADGGIQEINGMIRDNEG